MILIRMELGINFKNIRKIIVKSLSLFFILFLFAFLFSFKAEAKKSWIGVEFNKVSEEFLKINNLDLKSPKNIFINNVVKTSAADLAGILPGDIIVSINNIKIINVDDFINFLASTKPGDIISVKIYRNKNYIKKNVTLKSYPDSSFKPKWLASKNKYKEPKTNFTFENALLSWKGQILYPKYFSKKILNKYNHDNLTVVCVAGEAGNTLKLFDQIILINNKQPRQAFPLKPVRHEITIIRNGKKIKKNITPTKNRFNELRHDCTREFADFDCAVGQHQALGIKARDENGIIRDEKINAYKKVLECFLNKNVSIVPFHDTFKQYGRNLKFDAYIDYLIHLQYKYPEGHPNEQKNLPEINRVINLAKKDLSEFDKFQKIYPDHYMKKSYNTIVDRITSATAFAGSTYTGDFKSSKNQEIKSDKDIVKRTKNILQDLINTKSYDHLDTLKYLDNKRRFFEKSNEKKYLINHYEKVIAQVDFTKNDKKKYFSDFYFDLATLYNHSNRNADAIKLLDKGKQIAFNNYQDLTFMNAYGKLLSTEYTMSLLYDFTNKNQKKKDKEYSKAVKTHLANLDKLSNKQKYQIIKMDKDYYISLLQSLHVSESLSPSKKSSQPSSYWALKAFNYIKNNPDINLNYNYMGVLDMLLQSSIIDDDEKIFNLAQNEFKIFLSNSVNNKQKIYSIFSYAGSRLSLYDLNNLYRDSDELIEFIDNTFDLKDRDTGVTADIITQIQVYKGKYWLRKKNIDKTKLIYENLYDKEQIGKKIRESKIDYVSTLIIRKVAPVLFEIYANEKNIKKMNRISNDFFLKNVDQIKKRDIKDILDALSLDGIKVYKSLLIYFRDTKNTKKFKMINDHLSKNVDSILKDVATNSSELTLQTANSRIDILNELAQISEILVYSKFEADGKKILKKLYPIIIDDFNDKANKELWKPSIKDGLISKIYLNIAEKKYKNSKSFFNRAYSIAQAGKNTYTSRDLNKGFEKKNISDPDGLVEQYEKLKRELEVNLRNNQFKIRETSKEDENSNELNIRNREIQKKISTLKSKIEEKIPTYFKLTNIQIADIDEVQNKLNDNEILLDYYFFENDLKIILISKNNFEIVSNGLNLNKINSIKDNIRQSVIPKNNKLAPYAVNASLNFNNKTFQFFKSKLSSYKNIIIIPDGPLNSIPLHALATKSGKNCIDCRNIEFNLKFHNFNYYPSSDAFVSLDSISQDFKKKKFSISNKKVKNVASKTKDFIDDKTNIKPLKIVKDKMKKPLNIVKNKLKKNKESNTNVSNELYYLGIGDPDLYSKVANSNLDIKTKTTMLRSIFDTNNLNNTTLSEIYGPVEGSADEIKRVAEYLAPLKTKILLKENANESIIKNLDFTPYKIIHFATHGEISGAITGINEPFLVLSPTEKTSNEDGILTMSEIIMLDTNADLVILSACNTASGDEIGSEGFSGLAKSFFMSGSKSILVSNWYVETNSAKEIVISIFKNIKENNNLTISQSLNLTMRDMQSNKKNYSHPLFWAPFVLVGKNQSLSIH